MLDLNNEVKTFVGGKLKYFLKNWELLSTDKYIIDIIKYGIKLEFNNLPPVQTYADIRPTSFSKEEKLVIDTEVNKLLAKKVIIPCEEKFNGYVSGIFTRDKKDGSKRMILNLKQLNTFIVYKHFKMESINNVIDMLRPNAYMASIDLKDAFYSVPVSIEHQEYLKFLHNKLFQYTCMSNGYGPAMRIFTKLCKVPFTCLRSRGFFICCIC